MLERLTRRVLVGSAGGAVRRRCEVLCGDRRLPGADAARVMASREPVGTSGLIRSSTETKGDSPGEGESWSARAVWNLTFLAAQLGDLYDALVADSGAEYVYREVAKGTHA
jgi:hypothetical protein